MTRNEILTAMGCHADEHGIDVTNAPDALIRIATALADDELAVNLAANHFGESELVRVRALDAMNILRAAILDKIKKGTK